MWHVDNFYTGSNARNGMFENISLVRSSFKKSIFNPLLDVIFCRRVQGFPFYQYFIHFKHIHNLNNSDTLSPLKEASATRNCSETKMCEHISLLATAPSPPQRSSFSMDSMIFGRLLHAAKIASSLLRTEEPAASLCSFRPDKNGGLLDSPGRQSCAFGSMLQLGLFFF